MDADYDDAIEQGMNYQSWIQIKKSQKLCNSNITTNKGQDVTSQATYQITYGDALFKMSDF